MSQNQFDAPVWLASILATVGLGWVATTSRKVSQHDIEIAVLKTNVENIKDGIDEIKEHLGVPRKENK